jgi:hypothetical protein
LVGTWKGSYTTSSGARGKLLLELRLENSEMAGELSATKVSSTYGDDPQPISDVVVDGVDRTISFVAFGKDGDPASSHLTLSKNGKKLAGKTKHKSNTPNIRFKLKKQK